MLHFVRSKFFLPASWNRVFIVTLVFVTLASGLFWLDFFRQYRAEVTIFAIVRPGISQSGTNVAENLAGLTRTLSFYDRMLSNNDLIDDAFDGSTPDKRKELWNKKVSVRKQGDSGVLVIQATGDTPEAAKLFAVETAQTLFSVAGFYYNVKTDIDLRIIDGPLVSYVLVKPFLFATASLLTGISVTVLFFLFLNAVPGFIGPASLLTRQGGDRKRSISLDEVLEKHNALLEKHPASTNPSLEFFTGEAIPWIDPKKFIPTKPVALSFENVSRGMARDTSSGMRAPAPANLPVASGEMNLPVMDETVLPFEFEALLEESEAALSQNQGEFSGVPAPDEYGAPTEISELASPQGEPTADEYKRRLNTLLSGGN